MDEEDKKAKSKLFVELLAEERNILQKMADEHSVTPTKFLNSIVKWYLEASDDVRNELYSFAIQSITKAGNEIEELKNSIKDNKNDKLKELEERKKEKTAELENWIDLMNLTK